jgi:hypothetical protein
MTRTVLVLLLLCTSLAWPAAAALTQVQTDALVKQVDERQRDSGDYTAVCYVEAKRKDKSDIVNELIVYRRKADEKFVLLFTKPKIDAGKGYLRIDKNLWFYDPSIGRWERRTERERIGGTDTRREDLDESRLAEEYTARWEAEEKLGAHTAHRLMLEVKPGVDVAFPSVRLWIDGASGSLLKRQDLALSGRLMRTTYYPRWKKIFSESKGAEVWFPEEIRFYDEVEKANSTLLVVKQIDLRPVATNMFTKAWLEAKSR